jgi:hypothetical protein
MSGTDVFQATNTAAFFPAYNDIMHSLVKSHFLFRTVSFKKIRGGTSEKFAICRWQYQIYQPFSVSTLFHSLPMFVYNFTLSHCVVAVFLILAVLRK